MYPVDSPFTFMDRIEEIELNISDERWQSALALALTIPDICGGIAFAELVKKYRDGRIILDRKKKPARDIGQQYMKWFDEYAASFFTNDNDETPYICGKRCWQLRCEYLHQNKGFDNEEEDEVQFHLGVNCGTSVCRSPLEPDSSIRIDIKEFCLRMTQAARNYYTLMKDKTDFTMYNTPVLDFTPFQK